MLNIDNAEEAYLKQAHFVMRRIEERYQWEITILKEVFLSLK